MTEGRVKTRWLLSASALFMAVLGLATTFAPQELLAAICAPDQGPVVIVVQATGALYLGFAMLNWMARGSLIGGVYNRPVALANFLHFAVAAMGLVKAAWTGPPAAALVVAALVYAAFAAGFGRVLFTHPLARDSGSEP